MGGFEVIVGIVPVVVIVIVVIATALPRASIREMTMASMLRSSRMAHSLSFSASSRRSSSVRRSLT